MQLSGVKECCLCRLEANISGYYGELTLWVWLCPDHHEFGINAVHSHSEGGEEYDRLLKENAQICFEKIYGHDKWMEEFGKSYL